MSDNFDFKDNEHMRFIEQFLSKRENDTRRNITSISSVCEVLSNGGSNLSSEEMKQCLNSIMTSCCSVMKMTELYTRVLKAIFDSDISIKNLDLNKYMKVFVNGCNETLKSNCIVQYKTSDDLLFVKTNPDFFEYILLGSVRRLVINGALSLEISSEKLGNNDVVISFRAVESDPTADRAPFNDIDTAEFIGINSRLAEMIKAHFVYENGEILLKIVDQISDGAFLNSPEIPIVPNKMSSFHNMLADLSDYEFF